MTEERQRIAISRECGWTYHGMSNIGPDGDMWSTMHNEMEGVPDYPNDLNAMHEAEKVLVKYKPNDSDSIVMDMLQEYAENLGYNISATAAQRAEAFLKTLGLWE